MKASERLRAEIAQIGGEFYAYQFRHIRHYGTHVLRLESLGEIERVRTEKMPHAGLPVVIYKITKAFLVEKPKCMSRKAIKQRAMREELRSTAPFSEQCEKFTFAAWKDHPWYAKEVNLSGIARIHRIEKEIYENS